jgi:hypothetical protein
MGYPFGIPHYTLAIFILSSLFFENIFPTSPAKSRRKKKEKKVRKTVDGGE